MTGPGDLDSTPIFSDEDELLRRAGAGSPIAAPNVAKSGPALTLRGLGPVPAPAAAAAPTGSTADLESRGMASHIAPAPVAKPSAIDERTAADEAELARKEKTGSGISQIKNPFGRYALRGLETIGSIVSPSTAAMIPGTELHHDVLVGRDRRHIAQDIAEQGEAASQEKSEADSAEARARAESLLHPQAKEGVTDEEKTLHDLMTGDNGNPRINPETQKPYTYLEAYTAVAEAKAGAKPDVHPPVGKDSAAQYNASILREMNVNPKTKVDKIPPEYEVKEGDTEKQAQEKFQRAKDLVAGAAREQGIQINTGNHNDAQSSHSYDKQAKRIDDARKPIKETVARASRLMDTLNQKSPQADALVGPELLSIMSGGQGSGLRMNEAEIARIVGGRSHWEDLKASFQRWSLNPADARSITDEQDKQIRALVEAVNTKLSKKMQIIDAAEDKLDEAKDIKEHRKIVNQMNKDLDAIDEASLQQNAGGNQPKTVKIGGQEIAVGADGNFDYQGHTYHDNGNGKDATLVK